MGADDPDDEAGSPERPGGCPAESGSNGAAPDESLPLGIVIPDGLRDLAGDIAAYHREQRQAARRARLRRLFFAHRSARSGLSGPSGPIVAVALLGVALVGCLATLLAPRREPPPQAGGVSATPGMPGTLAPEAKVSLRGLPRQARDLRPAVLALVPPECGCIDSLEQVSASVTSHRLPLYVVGERDRLRDLTALASAVGNGATQVLIDEERTLTRAYSPIGSPIGSPTDLTLVLVRADGIVEAVVRRPDGVRLDSDLVVLGRSETR